MESLAKSKFGACFTCKFSPPLSLHFHKTFCHKKHFSSFSAHRKLLAATFSCSHAGMKALFLRLFALPLAMSLMWIFYSNVGDDAKGFYSKSAMILNILGLAYGAGVWVTVSLCK